MMIKKANPTLEGQLLEYLESAPDDKSEVMWNVLQHLRARQRGEAIENPTIEGRIAEYFETAALEKAEVLFNIIELKLGRRMEKESRENAEAGEPKAKKPRSESKGRVKAPEAATEKAGALGVQAEGRVKEPVMVPVEEAAHPEDEAGETVIPVETEVA